MQGIGQLVDATNYFVFYCQGSSNPSLSAIASYSGSSLSLAAISRLIYSKSFLYSFQWRFFTEYKETVCFNRNAGGR